MIFSLVKAYIFLIYYFKKNTSILFPGVGYVQNFLTQKYIINFKGKKIFYNPDIEGSYDMLLIGKANEPETHLFFEKVIPHINDKVNFVDVGASIGEMVISVSGYQNISSIYAFEPRPDCVKVLAENNKLNDEHRVIVYDNAVSDKLNEQIEIYLNKGGTSSGLFTKNESGSNSLKVMTTTLDLTLPKELKNAIILIDVEGAEPLVLRGGKEFIVNNLPLIISNII